MSLKDRLKEKKAKKSNIESPLFGRKQLVEDTVKTEVGKLKKEIMTEMRSILKELVGKKGINTIKGERGHTPKVGIDFLTSKEMANLKGERGDKGFDGTNADEKTIVKNVLNKIPKQKPPKPIKELVAKEVARMLETLRGSSEALDYFALRNLPNIPQDGKGRRTLHRGGQGLAVFAQDLSSQTDGSTKTFTVPAHARALSLTGSDFPFTYRLTTDFTTSGTTLTLTSSPDAPSSGATLWFVYAK